MNPTLHPLPEAPWGALIGVYLILAGMAAGTTLVAEWMRPQQDRMAVAFAWKMGWIALGALALCGGILIIDLGRPARFVLMLSSFANPGSAMSVGAKLIALKGFFLALYLFLLHRRRHALAIGDVQLAPGITRGAYTAVPALLSVTSLSLAAYPAILLSRTWSSPLAASPGAALLFVTTALLMGAAVGRLVEHEAESATRLRHTMRWLAGTQLCLLLLSGLSLYGGAPPLERALRELMTGRTAALFWGLAVGGGLSLPFVMLCAGRRQSALTMLSALCLLMGAATLRWLFFSVA